MQNWRAHFSGNPNQSPIYRDVSQSLSPGGIEYYLPLFYKETSTLFDYINDDSVLIYDDDVNVSADKFWEDVMARYQHIKEEDERPVLAPEKLFLLSPQKAAMKYIHSQFLLLGHVPKKALRKPNPPLFYLFLYLSFRAMPAEVRSKKITFLRHLWLEEWLMDDALCKEVGPSNGPGYL